MMFGFSPTVWAVIGFTGQGLFTARFLVQWLASEKKGESVVPVSFWWLSVFGSSILAFYAGALRDPVFLLGSLVNGFLYARNLVLIHFTQKKPTSRRVLIPTVLALFAFVSITAWGGMDRAIPVFWLALGFVGAVLWSGRFVIQWYASERAGKSVVPRSFWYVGLAGALLLLSYSVLRRQPVFILAYLFPPFPYVRNLVLIYRKEGTPPAIRWAQQVWRDGKSRAMAIAVFAGLLAVFLGLRVKASDGPAGDFLRYHRAAKAVVTGNAVHLYDPDFDVYDGSIESSRTYRNLPGLAVLMAPLGLLPPRHAELLWTWANAYFFLMTLAVCRWFTRRHGVRAAWMWIPFLLVLRSAWDVLNLGETHLAAAACVTGGLYLVETRRPLRGGLLAALAVSMHLLMALLPLLLLVRGRFRAAAACIGGIALLALVLPAAVAGASRAVDLLGRYGEDRLAPVFSQPVEEDASGVSARAICHRLLGPVPVRKSGEVVDVSTGLLTLPQAHVAYLGVAALMILAVFGAAVLSKGEAEVPLFWGVALCAILLSSPDTRQPQFVVLTLPATAAVAVLAARGLGSARTKGIVAALGLAFALAAIPSRGIVGPKAALLCHALCAVGFAAALLLLACGLGLAEVRRERTHEI